VLFKKYYQGDKMRGGWKKHISVLTDMRRHKILYQKTLKIQKTWEAEVLQER
jgi:hypothetical protein